MRLYLVMGESGEYEDRRNWVVKGYLNKRLAEHHAQRATKRGWELICEALNIPYTEDEKVTQKAHACLPRWEEIIENGESEWDSFFHVSYDRNISYYVSSTRIDVDLTPQEE